MRRYLFVIGILVFCGLFVKAEVITLAQTDPVPTVTLNVRQVSLQNIFEEIQRQTGMIFSYESSVISEFKKVSFSAQDESFTYSLKRLFSSLPLNYRIVGQYVIVKRKPRMFTISGFVRDSASYESLISATLFDRLSGRGTISNNYGFYSITLPLGEVILRISFVGYEPKSIYINLARDTMIDVALKSAIRIGEIIITGLEPHSEVLSSRPGVVNIPKNKVTTFPALLGEADIVKTLQRLPGTTMGTEGMTGLYVRGGDADENLYLLDGNPVYHTNHVLGFFSAFNPDAIKSTTFYKESFPAEYGGRLSSVIDVRTDDGDRKEYHGNLSIGLLAARANFEGPIIKDRSSFNVSFRRSWMDLITWPVLMSLNKDADRKIHGYYNFYDVNAKVNYSFSDRSMAYVSFYTGSDNYLDGEDSDDPYGADRTFRWRWGNLITSAGWNYVLSKKVFVAFTGGYTRYRSNILQKRDAYVSTIDEQHPQSYFQEGHSSSSMQDMSLRASFDYRPNAMHRIRFGGDYLFHNFRPEQSYMDTWYKDSVVSQKTNTVFTNSLIHGHEVSAFFEDEMRLTNRLRANIGARYTLFHVQRETYQSLQPRISARYMILRNLSAKISYSKMNQYIHLLSNSFVSQPTDIWVPVTERIGPMNSHQFTGGLYYRWKSIDFSVEGYYKRLNNLVDYKDNGLALASFSGWEDRVGLGKGRAYGMELMAKKSMGRLSGWLAYTLSWSDRWFPDGSVNKGRRFPAKYDNRHKIDIVATYKLSRKVELTSAWMYASGNHLTIMDQQYYAAVSQSDNGFYGNVYDPYGYSASSRNNYQLAPYHRLDLGANFYKYRKKGRISIWNVCICNVYMRPNPFMVSPVYYRNVDGKQYVKLQETILFRCFPSVSYTYKF